MFIFKTRYRKDKNGIIILLRTNFGKTCGPIKPTKSIPQMQIRKELIESFPNWFW
jgi:hypothetical protein